MSRNTNHRRRRVRLLDKWPRQSGSLLAVAVAISLCSCQAGPRIAGGRAAVSDSGAPPPALRAPAAVASPVQPTSAITRQTPPATYGVQLASYGPVGLPASAWTGQPNPWSGYGQPPFADANCATCPPPAAPMAGPPGAWRPPGIAGRWPYNEYLCDGGDQGAAVEVARDWTVRGLDQEDTVAHYDTVDGRTEIQPSNPVCVYAPRFAAVRQISGALVHEVHDRLADINLPVQASVREDRGTPTTLLQPVEPGRYVRAAGPQLFRERVRGESTDGAVRLAECDMRFRQHEDFQLIRTGVFDNNEKARLAERLAAAAAWSENQAAQVALESMTASIGTNDVALQSVVRYDLPPGKPRLRVVKVASKQSAQPGDEIEFTIRFDNVGDQTVGNVTIVDSLTTRLEYVPDSAQCDREAAFGTQENEGESLVLRWEIRSALKVGEGGIIRFTCRVR